jgi:hypothetical protein
MLFRNPEKPISSLPQKHKSTKMRDIDKDDREERWGEENKIFLE